MGVLPPGKRLKQLGLGFLVTAILCVLVQYLEAYLKNSSWILNEKITSGLVLKSLWWDFKSVLTEELLFRGALLYLLIQKIGSKKSILISAIAFGIYHWFSYEVFGAPVQMIYVFVLTCMFGLMLAYAFAKTGSLFLPVALHLGWNLTTGMVFSNGPLGEQLLLPSQTEMAVLTAVQQLLTSIAIPMLLVGLVIWLLRDQPGRFGN